jgi:hypothetical protein
MMTCLVGCERLSPAEEKLVGSWEARTAPDSVTTFTFERNHTEWCVVHFREDTWLDGKGRWHIRDNQLVSDDVWYPDVAPAVAAKDPDLARRPKHDVEPFEQLDQNTIKINGVILTRTRRPAKPKNPAPFSP